MGDFDPKQFVNAPDQDVFESLKKEDLVKLGTFLGLSIKSSWRKRDMQHTLLKHLVEIGKFDSSALSDYEFEGQSDAELKFKQFELKLRLEKEEREKEREHERERQEKEREHEIELEKLKMQREREEREMQERERERELEFQMKKLEVERGEKPGPSGRQDSGFDVTKYIRLVPSFQEKEVDKYFLHFEKIANSLKWPKEFWTMLLQSVLIVKTMG
ncbi:RNA-binding protein 25-like [Liolophura sinensis]|uniref:RNA-binding protein 25-like n=1 Tax=Liolophura sinensis TaxID=3198878 RepID=UPI003158A4C7